MFTGSFLILLKLQIIIIKKNNHAEGPHFFFLLFSRTSTFNPLQRAACNFFCCDVGGLAGGESRDFCVQNTTEEMYPWTGCRQRWGKRGNYHIERGEDGGEGFKIDLIFLDPLHPSSPPCFLSFQFFFAVYSEHALSCFVRHKESTEKSWNGDGREDGARLWGKVNSELVFGEGSSRRCPLKKKMLLA